MKRRIIGGAAVAIGAVAMMVGTAGGASAAWDNCPSGRSCFWGDTDYKTSGYHTAYLPFQYNFSNFSVYNYPSTSTNGTNSATSVTNNGNSARAQYYAGTGYTYPTFVLQPGGERDPNLSNGIDTNESPFWAADQVNDALSSACFIGWC